MARITKAEIRENLITVEPIKEGYTVQFYFSHGDTVDSLDPTQYSAYPVKKTAEADADTFADWLIDMIDTFS